MPDNKSSAVRALQDVKKMRRAIRLRESTDPRVVAEILENILRDTLVARQALGNTRMGKNAVKEIQNIRNDLAIGKIDVGGRTAEFLAKFTTVSNELKNLEDEEKQVSKSEAVQEAKETVRSIIPRKEMLLSALIATNPAIGYGAKLAESLGKSVFSRGSSNRKTQDVTRSGIGKIQKNLEGEKLETAEQLDSAVSEYGESSPQAEILSQKLDEIKQEIRNLREPIDGIERTTQESSNELESIKSESERSNDLQRINTQRERFSELETGYESYGDQGTEFSENDMQNMNLSDRLAAGVLGAAGLGESGLGADEGLVPDSVETGAAAAGGIGAASLAGRMVKSAAFLLGLKFAIAAGVGYAAWHFRDEIFEAIKNAGQSSAVSGGALGLEGEGTTSERIRSSVDDTVARQQAIIQAAEQDQAVISARGAVEATEMHQQEYQDELSELKDSFDNLLEQSERELEEDGVISEETRQAMLENNEKQSELRDKISNLDERISELNKILRRITVERRSFYRDSYEPEELQRLNRGESASMSEPTGLLDRIGELESGGNYNALVYGRDGAQVPSETDLTGMTIGEVQEYQRGMRDRGHASSAVGKYQIIESTLEGIVNSTPDIDEDTLFTPDVQDRLAIELMRGRGLEEFRRGEISTEEFSQELAKEWASVPTASGESFYEGFNQNTAGTSFDNFLSSVRDMEMPSIIEPAEASNTVSNVSNDTMDRAEQFSPESRTSDSPFVVNNINNNTQQSSQSRAPTPTPENNDNTWRRLTDRIGSSGFL